MATKKKIVKCRYSKCPYENKEVNKEEAVLVGKSSYYHKECFNQKETIEKIIEVFVTKINPNTVVSALRRIINVIVFERGISAEMLLFGVNYYISHNISLNHPGGLYYVVQNKNVQHEYDKLYCKKEDVKMASEITETEPEITFTHKPAKMKSITDILG